MIGYLLDTNVISEIMRTAPHPGVVAFLSEREDLWLSSIVIHELEYGVRRMPQGRRRVRLEAELSRLFREYEHSILSLERNGAEWAAEFRVQAQSSGRTLELGDALIAGIARANDLAVATRNITDFDGLDVEVVNPWDPQ